MERNTGISMPEEGMGTGGADRPRGEMDSGNLERIRRNLAAGFYDTHVVVVESARRMLASPEFRALLLDR